MSNWQRAIASTRAEIEDFHRTPPLKDCLAYAVTEAAEALDAILRIERVGDDRTRAHGATDGLGRELAQVVYMIGTAANIDSVDTGPLAEQPEETLFALSGDIPAVLAAVNMVKDAASACLGQDRHLRMFTALGMARLLAAHYDIDLERELELWLDELRERSRAVARMAETARQDTLPEIGEDMPLFAIHGGEA